MHIRWDEAGVRRLKAIGLLLIGFGLGLWTGYEIRRLMTGEATSHAVIREAIRQAREVHRERAGG